MSDYIKKAKKIIAAIDKALAEGPWEKSLFLRNIAKELLAIRQKFVEFVKKHSPEQQTTANEAIDIPDLQEGKTLVFISIYNAHGGNIQHWERTLANLETYIISRPIYAEEEQARAVIRSKTRRENEAYLAVLVDTQNIIEKTLEQSPKDRLGTPLLTLKNNSIKKNNLVRFVHITGTYTYHKGRLLLK